MKQYLNTLSTILQHGRTRADRTGTGTISIFGHVERYNINLQAFPMVTTKEVNFDAILKELLWFISGDTNNTTLVKQGVNIWKPWAIKEEDIPEGSTVKPGELGPVYGAMWRNWAVVGDYGDIEYVDQLSDLMENLKKLPHSRRHILSGWNPAVLPDETKSHSENVLNGKQILPPCHLLFHCSVDELTLAERIEHYLNLHGQLLVDGVIYKYGEGITKSASFNEKIWESILDHRGAPKQRLNSILYQRSADVPLGVPYNITSYCLLTAMIAHCLNMYTGTFTHMTGDTHIYLDQVGPINAQLLRKPKMLPTLHINPNVRDIFAFKPEDFILSRYNPHPAIKMSVAV